jgi:hypothetical protein
LAWSSPRYTRGTRAAYFNELFTINVDDEVRDGAVVQVVQTSLLGARQRVVGERVLLAGRVLPEAQRCERRAQLAAKRDNLARLLDDFGTLYDSARDEQRRMQRDVAALDVALALLAPDARFRADTELSAHPQQISLSCSSVVVWLFVVDIHIHSPRF